jgi:hypothetical protein
MNDNNMSDDRSWLNQMMQNQAGRMQALIDILYLTNTTWLYVFSIIYPLFGIIFGIILSQGSLSEQGKKIGKTCLILGIVNLALVVILVVLIIVLGSALTKMIPYSI